MPAPKAAPFLLVTADYHGKLIWWQGDSGAPKPLKTVAAHDGYARAVAVSPDAGIVVSCGNDHLIKLWRAADGAALRTLEGHTSHVYNVAFSPDGTRLVSCDLKGVVKDWDLKTGRCDRDIDAKVLHKYDAGFMADIGGARGMAFKSDGATVALCGITNVSNAFAGVGNPAVVLVDWKEGKTKLLGKTKGRVPGHRVGSVVFHPSGAVIAAGGGGQGRVWFWRGDDVERSHPERPRERPRPRDQSYRRPVRRGRCERHSLCVRFHGHRRTSNPLRRRRSSPGHVPPVLVRSTNRRERRIRRCSAPGGPDR